MRVFLVNSILSLFVFVYAWKRKQFRYTAYAALSLMYFLLTWLHRDYRLIDSSNLFSHLQRLILFALAAFACYWVRKPLHKKMDIAIVVLGCSAFVFRLARTCVFHYFKTQMLIPGADVLMLNETLTLCYLIVDAIVNFSVVLILFIMAIHFGSPKRSPSK